MMPPQACSCENVAMGSYANQELRSLPFSDSAYQDGGRVVGIDRCILPTVEFLWELGIETIESCCGHGKATGYVAVVPHHGKVMKALGFDPDDRTTAPGVFMWPAPPRSPNECVK